MYAIWDLITNNWYNEYENTKDGRSLAVTRLFISDESAEAYMRAMGICRNPCCTEVRPVTLTDNSEGEA